MTIGDLIDLLREKAGELDERDRSGLNVEVALAWCQEETLGVTREIDADVWTQINIDTESRHALLLLRGHPHRDAGGPVVWTTPFPDADAQLERWAHEDPEPPSD